MKTSSIFFLVLLTPILLFSQHEEQKYSLFFENDKHELTTQHIQLLDSIKQFDHKDDLDIHIKGYTNNVGNEAYNLRLSQKRAMNVKAMLREFTIISSQGYGELGSDAAQDRRVEILIHNKEDHVAEEGEIVEAPQVKVEVKTENFKKIVDPRKGDKITLDGIMFYPDRDVIMDESKAALEELLKFLQDNPNINFKLIGHICCGDPIKRGKDLKNLRTGKDNLSEARAQALHNYLAKNGINKRRMRYIGMAFRQPTGRGDLFDRRVEIEITYVREN